MSDYLAQEESANAKASAAAREKKAAKKARRKERDAAVKAADQPAASAAPTPAHGSDNHQTRTDAATPAAEAAEAPHANTTAAQAASVSSKPEAAGDCAADDRPAALPEASKMLAVDRATPTPARDEAALPAAAAEAGRWLPPAGNTQLGGDWADLPNAQRPDTMAVAAASDSREQGHKSSHKASNETDAHADSALGPPRSRTRLARSHVGDGDDGRDDSKGACWAEGGDLRDASRDSSDPCWVAVQPDGDQTDPAGPPHTRQLPAPTDAANDEDVLSQLLGSLGVSDRDRAPAQPHGTQSRSPMSPAEIESAATDSWIEHMPAAGMAGIGAGVVVSGSAPDLCAGWRRRTAPPQDDAPLLCPISQVGLLHRINAVLALVLYLRSGFTSAVIACSLGSGPASPRCAPLSD